MAEKMCLEMQVKHRRSYFIALFQAVSVSVPSRSHHGHDNAASKSLGVRDTRHNLRCTRGR